MRAALVGAAIFLVQLTAASANSFEADVERRDLQGRNRCYRCDKDLHGGKCGAFEKKRLEKWKSWC